MPIRAVWRVMMLCGFLVAAMRVAAAPIADASKSENLKGAAPLTSTFYAADATCVSSCSYAWNFGDKTSQPNSSSTFATHTYTTAGRYTATLTVTDNTTGAKSTYSLAVTVVPSESLTDYVAACKTQLGFQGVSIPNMDCYDSDLFAPPTVSEASLNDRLGYRKINDQVDLAFVCRWLPGSKQNRQLAASVELLIHNRQNGNTCFFSGKTDLSGALVPSNIISPTDAAASSYWAQPASVDANVRCIGCHVSGPYIASPKIAPYLAKYGLLNNGHDTLSNVTWDDLSSANPSTHVKYHAISGTVNGAGGAFSLWDGLKQTYVNSGDSSCSLGCDVVGTASTQRDIVIAPFGTLLHAPSSLLDLIDEAGVMSPYDEASDYRWINLDTAGDGVEAENFGDAKNASTTLVPALLISCDAPNLMEAHVVGSSNQFLVAEPSKFAYLPDRLASFNLKDGLVCLNSDQDPGHLCQDYKIRYECTDTNGNKTWSSWYNTDSPSGDGDHEERSKHANVCASPSGSKATAIQAAFTAVNSWTYSSIGPNDRLAKFSQYGLTCNTADQPDGQCSNYVVRYSSCGSAPTTVTKFLTNVFTGKQLTAATGSLAKGQPHNGQWNTQQWSIEPVKNTEYVRLKNSGTNVYLTVASQSESATVGTAAANTSTNQMWLIEPVAGASDVRFKNLFSGKYLTMADPKNVPNTPDYLPIYSQARNTGWTSQRWAMQ